MLMCMHKSGLRKNHDAGVKEIQQAAGFLILNYTFSSLTEAQRIFLYGWEDLLSGLIKDTVLPILLKFEAINF